MVNVLLRNEGLEPEKAVGGKQGNLWLLLHGSLSGAEGADEVLKSETGLAVTKEDWLASFEPSSKRVWATSFIQVARQRAKSMLLFAAS